MAEVIQPVPAFFRGWPIEVIESLVVEDLPPILFRPELTGILVCFEFREDPPQAIKPFRIVDVEFNELAHRALYSFR
jgi:hypothetical protein